MTDLFKGYRDEFTSRVLSSVKRISKFIGILLIPILYGITCLLGFWNPVNNIGKAPVVILNEDKTVWVYKTNNSKMNLGVLTDSNFNSINGNLSKEEALKKSYNISENYLNTNTGKISASKEQVARNIFKFNIWDIFKKVLVPKTDETIKDEDYTFSSPEIKEGVSFTNIKYISNQEEIDKAYKGKKYYVQFKINNGFTENVIQKIGSIFNKNDIPKTEDVKLSIWTTYERNFIFGYYMNSMIEMKSAFLVKAAESILGKTITNWIIDTIIQQTYKNVVYTPTEDLKVSQSNGLNSSSLENDVTIKSGNNYVISDAFNISQQKEGYIESKNTIFGDISERVTLSKAANVETDGKFTNLTQEILDKLNDSQIQKVIKFLDLDVTKLTNYLTVLNDNSHIVNKILYDITHGIKLNMDNQKIIVNTSNIEKLGINKRIIILFDKFQEYRPLTIKVISKVLDTKLSLNLNNIKSQDLFESSLNTKNRNAVTLSEFNDNLDSWTKLNYGVDCESLLKSIVTKNINKLKVEFKKQIKIVDIEIAGIENGVYGIGIGEFFIVIGLFVGTFMQTFIYDRARRTKKLSAVKWYSSKTLLMLTTGILQVSLMVFVLSLTGYMAIGSTAMFSLWLWLLFVDVIFILTIQGLWFLIKDETVSKVLVIIYMVINISSGWGTFPAFMQFEFFHKLSFVAEFTYIMHGLGSIIYGVGGNGFNTNDTLYILQQAAILMIFGLVFLFIGLMGAIRRNKEIRFGSFIPKHIIDGMNALNMSEVINFKTENKIFKYNWKVFDQDIYQELVIKVRELHPLEGQFKWYKKRNNDGVFPPNESDIDVIKRNDDVEV